MTLSTSQLRAEYGPEHCKEHVHAGAQGAWDAHQAVMRAFGYELRPGDTGSRSCRPITGGTAYSLHAFYLAVQILLWNLGKKISGAVACDFNWNTNPYGARLVTDMPRAMVDAICAIRTRSGAQVFRWGGYYSGNKDAMHFEIVCSSADLATGIDPTTVHGGQSEEDDMTPAQAEQLARIEVIANENRWNANTLVSIAAKLGALDKLDDEIVAGVLASLTPEAIAAAIPKDIAAQVADELHARLAS